MTAPTPKPCGLCCKLVIVNELNKPAGQWCQHYARGRGCTIHVERPEVCKPFQCVWTMTPYLDERWRPDNARFMMVVLERQLIIECDSGFADAWRREPYYAQIKRWSRRETGQFDIVVVRARGRLTYIFPEADVDLGPYRENARVDFGYEMKDGRMLPYARYAKQKPHSA